MAAHGRREGADGEAPGRADDPPCLFAAAECAKRELGRIRAAARHRRHRRLGLKTRTVAIFSQKRFDRQLRRANRQ
jgi:hypothetical protein